MYVIILPLFAFSICALLHAAACTLFPRLGLLDHPEKYNLARKRLPYPTGILAVVTFLIFFIATRGVMNGQAVGLTLSIVVLAITSMVDDVRGLPWWGRLSIQALIGCILFFTGTNILSITNPFGGNIKFDSIITYGSLPLISGLFTVIWVMTTVNALNWLDGIPGQVSILSCIGSLTLGLLALSDRVQQPEIALIAFLVTGCAAASALFDLPPNRVVLGDTGAMFFGLLLGTLSIYGGGKVATAFLVLGVPLLDLIIVIAHRILKGHSPFHGDAELNEHLHHKLRARGWSDWHIILLTILLGSTFGISALFMSTLEKFIAIILFGIVMVALSMYAGMKPQQ